MHKPNQSELQLDQSQLSYLEYLDPVPQEVVRPNIVKKAHNTIYRGRDGLALKLSY